MEHLTSWLASPGLAAYRLMAGTGGAVCRVNGEVVPCEKLWEGFKWFASAGVGFAVALFLLGIIALIFWLKMLIHAIRMPIEHKPVWILVLLLTGLLGAIIYYFAVKRSSLKPPAIPATPLGTTSLPPTT